jgi:hypothetical protein
MATFSSRRLSEIEGADSTHTNVFKERTGPDSGRQRQRLTVPAKQLIPGHVPPKVPHDVSGEVPLRVGRRMTGRSFPVDRRPGDGIEERLSAVVLESRRCVAKRLEASEELGCLHPVAVDHELRPGEDDDIRNEGSKPGEPPIPKVTVHEESMNPGRDAGRPRHPLQRGESLAARSPTPGQCLGDRLCVVQGIYRANSPRDQPMGFTKECQATGGMRSPNFVQELRDPWVSPVEDGGGCQIATHHRGAYRCDSPPPPWSEQPTCHCLTSARNEDPRAEGTHDM